MSEEAIIQVRNLKKSFGGRAVLKGVNLDVFRGETMVIMGGSGCGKSTLLRHVIGQVKPDEGTISLLGKDVASLNPTEKDKLRLKFGMSFQSSALFDSMTVGENVALPLKEHTDLDASVIKIVVKMKLELVGLTGFEDLIPSQLSGGMRKRVGIARAIVMDPELVFYDEPTAGLDPVMTAVVDKLIMDLSKKLNITSMVVTHDMKSVFRIADRIMMLHMGEVLQIGTPDEIRQSDNAILKQFVEGDADGPVQFVQSGNNYLQSLTED
ncbi:MAG: phospholipid/cholesterol/gamma-HCH transport system ATP-binding protein [Candidatus Omnitrophota bacterium]|jgi:phospholipid/cholesterol/gamma-HCH transport system ATP-binding protein